jgi:hypothetical protein
MPAPAPPPRLAWRLADSQAGAFATIVPVPDPAEPELAPEDEAPEDEAPDDEAPEDEPPDDVEAEVALPAPAGGAADDADDAAQPAVMTATASSGMASSVFFMGSPVTYL